MTSKNIKWYRSQVGYIQQDPYGAMAPFMTVERILEEPMLINRDRDHKSRLDRIEQSLTEVKVTPIQDFLPKFPHMLSGWATAKDSDCPFDDIGPKGHCCR